MKRLTETALVVAIEAEQTLVAANRELIARFEQKIQTTLDRPYCRISALASTQHVRQTLIEAPQSKTV
jgi:hypothetical protein